MEIKLQKRYKYAGDILEALIEKAGFPLDVAGEFLNSIKDAEVIEQKHGEWCWEVSSKLVPDAVRMWNGMKRLELISGNSAHTAVQR